MSTPDPTAMSVDKTPPNATIYIRNLPEKLPLDALRTQLNDLFADMGTVHEIRVSKNIRLRGQAFVNFDSADEATDIVEFLDGFEFHGKPLAVTFAKEKSDRTVLVDEGPEALQKHKEKRLKRKEETNKFWEEKLASLPAAAKGQGAGLVEGGRRAKRAAARGEEGAGGVADGVAGRPTKISKGAAMADDFLPPNKILLVRDIPVEYPADGLKLFFNRFGGFTEIRTTAARKGVAFVEYETAEQASVARESLNGIEVGGGKIRVTFQKT